MADKKVLQMRRILLQATKIYSPPRHPQSEPLHIIIITITLTTGLYIIAHWLIVPRDIANYISCITNRFHILSQT